LFISWQFKFFIEELLSLILCKFLALWAIHVKYIGKKCFIFLLLGTFLFQLGIAIEPTNIVGSWCMSCINISLIIWSIGHVESEEWAYISNCHGLLNDKVPIFQITSKLFVKLGRCIIEGYHTTTNWSVFWVLKVQTFFFGVKASKPS